MTVKLLTDYNLEFLSLKRGCTCSSQSTLIKMPHCWKSHVTAQIYDTVTYEAHLNYVIKVEQEEKLKSWKYCLRLQRRTTHS